MRIDVYASGSKGNCYRVSDGKESVLIDAGIPLKQIIAASGFSTGGICGCLISHSHL